MIHKLVYLWENYIFKRQLISAHKHVMCCEGTVAGLKLPEDGVNKHWNTQEQELMSVKKHSIVHDSW